MKLHLILAACAVLTPFATQAAEPLTARLAQPVAAKTRLIAGGAMFVCEGQACVAAAPSSRTFSASACKVIAEKIGAVTSFGGAKALDSTRLADCNARGALAHRASTTIMAAK